METTASSPVTGPRILDEIVRRLSEVPGSRWIASNSEIFALDLNGAGNDHPRRLSPRDGYVGFSDLLVVRGSADHVCVVGHGHGFDNLGRETGIGWLAAILLRVPPGVSDHLLLIAVTTALADPGGNAVLLAHDGDGVIKGRSDHAWWHEILTKAPTLKHQLGLTDGLMRYNPEAAADIVRVLLPLIAAGRV